MEELKADPANQTNEHAGAETVRFPTIGATTSGTAQTVDTSGSTHPTIEDQLADHEKRIHALESNQGAGVAEVKAAHDHLAKRLDDAGIVRDAAVSEGTNGSKGTAEKAAPAQAE
jgi:hypothetical protein